MAQGKDKRRFKRLKTSLIVRLRRSIVSDETRRRVRERIGNMSMGGVFIEANMPYESGSLVEFDFTLPGTRYLVHARGVVRWSNAGRLPDQPIGMGIEFLEIATESREQIRAFLQQQETSRNFDRLARTRLHREILKLHHRKTGTALSLPVLANFLGAPSSEVLAILPEFTTFGLLRKENDSVHFLAPKDPDLAEHLRRWIEKHAPR